MSEVLVEGKDRPRRYAPRVKGARRSACPVIVYMDPSLLVRLQQRARTRGLTLAAAGAQLLETALLTNGAPPTP